MSFKDGFELSLKPTSSKVLTFDDGSIKNSIRKCIILRQLLVKNRLIRVFKRIILKYFLKKIKINEDTKTILESLFKTIFQITVLECLF